MYGLFFKRNRLYIGRGIVCYFSLSHSRLCGDFKFDFIAALGAKRKSIHNICGTDRAFHIIYLHYLRMIRY